MNRKWLYLSIACICTLLLAAFLIQRARIHAAIDKNVAILDLEQAKVIAEDIERLRKLANDPQAPSLKPRYQKTIAQHQDELRKLGMESKYPEAMAAP